MYKIEQHAAIHNRFDVIVQDARTGQVKQTAVAYNIILNKWFNSVSYTGGLYAEYTHLTQIGLGTGTGTLAVTRSDLFTALVYKTATVVETVYASPTSYVTKEIRLEAEEYVGSTITEVGFRDTYATYKQLVTHAFLKDSEGNQIAIAKTADDVVIVRGTFYVTFTNGGFGTNGIYAPPSENKVISCLFGFNSMPMEARFSRYVSDTPAHMGEYLHGQKTTSMSACTRDTTLWKIDYPVFTWGDTECNGQTIRQIGMPGFAAISLPDSSMFSPIAVSHLPVGTGDGSATEFDIGSPLFVPDSETIYVDGVVQTRGTDYTADPTNNMIDMRENYWTAALTVWDENVVFGDIQTRTPSAYKYYDPIAWGHLYTHPSPNGAVVSAEYPIWIDFGQARACNRMKFEQIPTASLLNDTRRGNMVIESSADNTTWSAVTYTRDGQVYSFALTSARYWRVYISGYTWWFTFQEQTSTPNAAMYQTTQFFLGKTVPGLVFATPPAAGAAIEASFTLDYPYKTANNLLKFTASLVFTRGAGS